MLRHIHARTAFSLVAIVPAVALALAPASCLQSSPDTSIKTTDAQAPATTATIGAAGGRILSGDGRLQLDIPPDALDGDVAITITPAEGPADAVGTVYEIGPSGTTFKQPVGIAITYDPALYDGAPGSLSLATVEDGEWRPVSWPAVDPAEHVVAGSTTHLSPYGLVPFSCTPVGKSGCFLKHQRCVKGIGIGGKPACGLPCRTTDDCPEAMFCDQGACLLAHCKTDEVCSGSLLCAGFPSVCTPPCAGGSQCPEWAACDGVPTGRACNRRGCYQSDSECGPGAVCLQRLNTTSVAPGLCARGKLGCSCADPACPCERRDEEPVDAGVDAAPTTCEVDPSTTKQTMEEDPPGNTHYTITCTLKCSSGAALNIACDARYNVGQSGCRCGNRPYVDMNPDQALSVCKGGQTQLIPSLCFE